MVGSRGYSAATTYLASTDGNLTPAGSLSNPFPNGVTPPQGNSQGLLTGAGGVVDFVDQDSQPGDVQQSSLDFQRTIFGGSVIGFGYMGSRSERLSMGGTSDATVLEDNQFGESNTFSNRQGSALDNYDLGREFGVSLLDVAHRLNVNVTPFERSRRYNGGSRAGSRYLPRSPSPCRLRADGRARSSPQSCIDPRAAKGSPCSSAPASSWSISFPSRRLSSWS